MSVSFFHPELGPQDNPADLAAAQAGPTPEPPAPEPTPEPRKFAGKYNSPEALEQGYWESQREAMRIMAENESLKRERSQPQHPAPEPLAPLEDYGIPPHVIRAAIQAEVNATVERQVQDQFQKAFAPMVQGMSARANVSRRHPDFEELAPKISEYIGSNPSLNQQYTVLSGSFPEEAMEMAYLQYRDAHRKPDSAAAEPTTGALPRGGPAQRQVPGNDNREELQRARQYYEVMKDPRPYLRARFKDMIPDSHFEER
jgi:hypothetical protein